MPRAYPRGVLEISLRLTCLLNALAAGTTTAAHAEEHLNRWAVAHHVNDPDELLALPDHDPIASLPIRQALARLEHGGIDHTRAPEDAAAGIVRTDFAAPTVWELVLPTPGNYAGLRGPTRIVSEALDAGTAVICHQGAWAGTMWIGTRVGHGVHWRILRANPPLPPMSPLEALQELRAQMRHTADLLEGLGLSAGERPDTVAPRLGSGYSSGDQAVLETAWTVWHACQAGLDSAHEVLTAHGVRTRLDALYHLRHAAGQAITAATAWPKTARPPH